VVSLALRLPELGDRAESAMAVLERRHLVGRVGREELRELVRARRAPGPLVCGDPLRNVPLPQLHPADSFSLDHPFGQRSAMADTTVVRNPGEGTAYWMLGGLYELKAGADETGGAMSLFEMTIPPGAGPPAHTHPGGEAVYVLEGSVRY